VSALWRVRDRATFAELRRSGRRSRSGPVSVTWLPGDAGAPPRLACSIGRQVGPAVTRNRLRRRIRAIVADAAPDLRPGTYLVGVGPAATDLTHGDLRAAVLHAIAALPDASAAPGGLSR
jgi:ribonuclease P protein component